MSYPVIASSVDTDFNLSATSFSVNLPGSLAVGDRVVIAADFRSTSTITPPSGYTLLRQVAGGGSVGGSFYWERICNGTEGSTATFNSVTATSAAFKVLKITGAHASTQSEISNPGASGDVSAVNPQGVTASWGADDNLFIAFGASSAATMNFTAAPTNYSGLSQNVASSGGATCNIAYASRNFNSASDDPSAFTTSSNRWWSALTLVVRPVTVPVSSGKIKLFNGTSFVVKPVKVWNGSLWVTKSLKFYNGTSWESTSY